MTDPTMLLGLPATGKVHDMNPYMAAFVFLGIIYLGILVWGLVSWLPGSIVIAVMGLAVCAVGWYMSKEYLS